MILGYLTCGILSIPAVILCAFAMYREPRGLAIAGFVLSLPAVFGLIFFGFLFVMGLMVHEMQPPLKNLPTARELMKAKAEQRQATMSDAEVDAVISEYQEKR